MESDMDDALWYAPILALQHMHTRMQFVDPSFSLTVVTQEEVADKGLNCLPNHQDIDVFYALNIQDENLVGDVLKDYAKAVPNAICLNCTTTLNRASHLKSFHPYSRLSALLRRLPFNLFDRKRRSDVFNTVTGFWDRGHSDDLLVSRFRDYDFICVSSYHFSIVADPPFLSLPFSPVHDPRGDQWHGDHNPIGQ